MKPTGVVDGKIVFSNVKLRMLGTIIKARIYNNDRETHVVKGMKIDKVGRGDLVFEHPTRIEIPGTRKKKLVPPTIATDAGSSGYTDRYINLLFTTRKTIDPLTRKSGSYIYHCTRLNQAVDSKALHSPYCMTVRLDLQKEGLHRSSSL